MKPQYPMNDPYAINRLLTQLLAVVVTILVVVVGGLCVMACQNSGRKWNLLTTYGEHCIIVIINISYHIVKEKV